MSIEFRSCDFWLILVQLNHCGLMTHICVSKLTIIGSDNGLSPGRRQAIICTNAEILLIRTLGTNAGEILSEIHTFSFTKMHLKVSSAKWLPFLLGLNVLTHCGLMTPYGDRDLCHYWLQLITPLSVSGLSNFLIASLILNAVVVVFTLALLGTTVSNQLSINNIKSRF